MCVAQFAAVGVGIAWGLGAARGIRWLGGHWLHAGGLALLMLLAEGLRRLASRRLRVAVPAAPWICLALGSYAAWIMLVEAFLWYTGDKDFIRGVLLILPFLLAMSPLVRAGAWLGVAGSAVFFATSLAMLIGNGSSESGGSGFFLHWVV